MAKVLITGISGFIGSSIARALLAEGASVRGIDNLSTGKIANLDEIRSQIDLRMSLLARRFVIGPLILPNRCDYTRKTPFPVVCLSKSL